ncbi:MAG: helix-turn-helix domain-containing protein [Mycobacterium sp.]|nr:helix-turn-helix domain-containing protein [Mycobacterium sp.]
MSVVEETYLPEPEQADRLAVVRDFLAAHERRHGGTPAKRYLLVGTKAGDQVEIPQELYRVLRQAVEALTEGYAVTLVPRSLTVTTQQAADFLGISRPTLIKLLDEGKIPYERLNAHRRLRLADVRDYRERRRAEQYEALMATSVDIEEEDDEQEMLARLAAARKTIAAQRRSSR